MNVHVLIHIYTKKKTTGGETDGDDLSDECAACFDLTDAQREVLASYGEGGKQIICDPTCEDGVSDVSHCNCEIPLSFFSKSLIWRARGSVHYCCCCCVHSKLRCDS